MRLPIKYKNILIKIDNYTKQTPKVRYSFVCVRFVGRAIVMPIRGINGAWSEGVSLGNNVHCKQSKRMLLGTTLVSSSLVITSMAYIYCFPVIMAWAATMLHPLTAFLSIGSMKTIVPVTKSFLAVSPPVVVLSTLGGAMVSAISTVFSTLTRRLKGTV